MEEANANVNVVEQYVVCTDWNEDPAGKVTDAATVSHMSRRGRTADEARAFVRRLVRMGHTSPLEFVAATFEVRTTRAVANELVRHRMASFCQESTRYVDYRDGLDVIRPSGVSEGDVFASCAWWNSCEVAHSAYVAMLDAGASREDARSVLPLCTATTLRMRFNMRSFRNFLTLRHSMAAAPAMREIAALCVLALPESYLVFVEDLLRPDTRLPRNADIMRRMTTIVSAVAEDAKNEG